DADADRGAERRAAAPAYPAAQEGARRARRNRADGGKPRGSHEAPSARDVGRPAAARRHRARHRVRSQPAAVRRADTRPRPQYARRDPDDPPGAQQGPRQDHRHGDPRPGGRALCEADAAPRQGPVRRTGACRVNDFSLMRKNLFRRKLRAGLMIVSILVAFMIFGVLAGFYRAFTAGEDRAAADRLITVNRINFTQPMPVAYFNRVRAVDGVRQVSYANWFGGYYQDPKNIVMTFAVEPTTYFDVYRNEFELPADQLQAFIRNRTGAVVGEAMARKWGWKVGDRVPLSSNIFTQKSSGGHTWDFTIVGIVQGKGERVDTNFVLFQWAYFDETRTFGK